MPIEKKILSSISDNDPTLLTLSLRNQGLIPSDIKDLTEALKKNSYLTALDLSGNQLGDESAILLTQLSRITSLSISANQIGEIGAIALAQNKNFIVMDISQNRIGDTGASAFAKNPALLTLNLAGNQITYEGASSFADNCWLKWLDLSENQVNDLGAIGLSHNRNLITLLVASNQISDAGAVALARHITVTKLVLHHNKITINGSKALSKNTVLTFLDLSYNRLSIEGACAITESVSIHSLFLAGNDINNMGIANLAHNSILTLLDISYNQINDDGAKAFNNNQRLRELNISHNQLTVRGALVLAKLPNLRVLHASYNLFGDEGTIALAESNSLTYLDLAGNQVGPTGVQTISDNIRLTKLVLSYNLLGDAGALMLAYNTTLSELWLSYNQIGDLGAIALARNKTLKVLSVNYNFIKEKGRRALIQNTNFQSLSISSEQPPEFTTENLGTIFALTQDLLCIRATNDIIQFFNPTFSRVLGYEDDELLSKPLRDFLHPDDLIKDSRHSFEEHQKFPISQRTYRYRHKNGTYRLIQWSSQMKNGRIYASGIDITEQQQATNKLIRTEQQNEIAALKTEQTALYSQKQSRFIAHLCHEIRNPLSGISSNVEALQDHIKILQTLLNHDHDLPSKAVIVEANNVLTMIKECLTDIEICTEHEETILNDNLDVAKMAESKLQLVNIPFDLKNAVYEVCRMLRGRAHKKGLVLNTTLPEKALWVKGDPARVKQIVLNLVSNALKFTNQGFIELALLAQEYTPTHTKFEICITDTGIGLTKNETSNLFQRFTQSTETIGGSGLGLVIAKNLAHLMDGDITIDSKKGEGSKFRCTIKCNNLQEQERKLEDEKTVLTQLQDLQPQIIRKLTVLIVDDNEINRKVLGYCLTKIGHICLFANDGQEAVMQYTKLYPDIILMDIMMPNLDGLGATREIRRLEHEKKLKRTPIIALTGNALDAQRQEALDAGMDDYVTKPYKRETILDKMLTFFSPLSPGHETLSPSLSQKFSDSMQNTKSQQAFWQSPSSGGASSSLCAPLVSENEEASSILINRNLDAPKVPAQKGTKTDEGAHSIHGSLNSNVPSRNDKN